MITNYPENTVSVSEQLSKRFTTNNSTRVETPLGSPTGLCPPLLEPKTQSSSTLFGSVSHGDSTTDTICISIVDERIKREFIFKKLCLLNIGYIHKLTEVPYKYQPGYKRVYIRIRWNTEPKTIGIRNNLSSGQTVKFVYDLPWFWVITQL